MAESQHFTAPYAPVPPSGGDTGPITLSPDAVAFFAPAALPRLPNYDILQELGRGGMGVVYLARHAPLNRQVALKMLLHNAFASEEVRARFLAEAETIARLHHPGIVQVYDFGMLEGTPFFAMEYVAGGSLDRVLAGNPQPPRDAAVLIHQVALAVQHAHERNIVHRDLKPANILLLSRAPEARAPEDAPRAVEGGEARAFGARLNEAVPKVTDFGLAKQLDMDTALTATGAIVGTPPYMAPEQALADIKTIGPRTDVYALGAILYEMLTGRPPFMGATPLETLEHVYTQEPVAPSRLQPKTPRDLETICLKCLMKETSRRYATAHALAEDVQRFLDGRPILARPVGAVARAVKWAKRRPVVAGLLGLLVLTLVGLSVVVALLWRTNAELAEANTREADQRQRAEEHGQRAEEHFQLAKEVTDKLVVKVTDSELFKGEDMRPARKLLLEQMLPFYEKFQALRGDDRTVQVDAARNYLRIAQITFDIGDREKARQAYVKAVELWENLAKAHPDVDEYQVHLAGACNNLANLLHQLGHVHEVQPYYERAMRLYEQRWQKGDHFNGAEVSMLIGVKLNLGMLHLQQRRPALALPMYQEALHLSEQSLAQAQLDEFRSSRAAAWNGIGNVHRMEKRAYEAAQAYQEAYRLLRDLHKEQPKLVRPRIELGHVSSNLGVYHLIRGELPAAQRFLEESLQMRQGLLTAAPQVVAYRVDTAYSFFLLGQVLHKQGMAAEAEQRYRQSQELWEKLCSEHPAVPSHHDGLQKVLHQLKEVQSRRDPAAWITTLLRLAEVRTRLLAFTPEDPDALESLAIAWTELATVQSGRGKPEEALQAFGKACPLLEKMCARPQPRPEHRRALGGMLYNMGVEHGNARRWADARQWCEKALASQEKLLAEAPAHRGYQYDLALTCSKLGECALHTRQWSAAMSWLERALQMREKLVTPGRPDAGARIDLAGTCCNLAIVHMQTVTPARALPLLDRAQALLEEVQRTEPKNAQAREALLSTHHTRGGVLLKLQRPGEAVAAWDRVLALVTEPEPAREFRLCRALALARAGDAVRAAAEAEALAASPMSDGEKLEMLARVFALCAGQTKEGAVHEKHAAGAVELLRKAQAIKYYEGKGRAAALKQEADFASLRGRADFDRLLAELAKTVP